MFYPSFALKSPADADMVSLNFFPFKIKIIISLNTIQTFIEIATRYDFE